jgi:hypothetical protein
VAEDLVVRQYRFLLRTAPPDALEEAHVEALGALSENHRAAVLRGVQSGLVAGLRLTHESLRPLAHLITLGERRAPGAFLRATEPHALRALADHVVLAEASFALFAGYAAWDGREPEAAAEVDDSAFAEPWHIAHEVHVTYRATFGGVSSPDSFGGPRGQ